MSIRPYEKLMELSRASSRAPLRDREVLTRAFNRTLAKDFGVQAGYSTNAEGNWTGFNPLNQSGYNGISERTVKTISTYFACIRVISNGCAKLPLKFFTETVVKGRTTREPYNDDLTYILSVAPNERITYFDFWNTMDGWAVEGGAFAKKEFSVGGDLLGLYPIHPSRIQIIPNPKTGIFVFKVYNNDGTTINIPESEMFYYFGESIDGYVGYSMMQLMQNTLSRSNSTDRYARHFFTNNGRPTGALITDEKLSPQARLNLKKDWADMYGGPMNAGKTAVLESGLKYQPFAPPFKDLEFTEQWKFNQRQICEFMGVNPRKVGVESNSKGWATIDAEETEHLNSCLMPWILRKEQNIRRQLMPEWKYPRNIKCEFDFGFMLRGDVKTRAEMAEKKVMNGVWSPNDWLAADGENPSQYPGMDSHYCNGAMIPLEKSGQMQTATIASPDGNNPSGK